MAPRQPSAQADSRARLKRAGLRVTVYRTLNTLVEAGIAHRVDPGDRVYRFGLSAPAGQPAAAHRHPHFVCDECGAMECVEDAEVIVRARPARRATGSPDAKGLHRRVTRQEVLLRGTCGDCKPRPARKPAPRRRRTA